MTGVDVLEWTLANQAGTTLDRPMTHMYRACPSIATNSDVSIPKLAPTPINLDTHSQPSDLPLNAAENGASTSICVLITAPNNNLAINNRTKRKKKKKRKKGN